MSVVHVTESNFEQEVLNSQIPVLVDFGADWCAPCVMIDPVIGEIAKDTQGRLKVVKVNVDEAQQLAANYGIMSIPTLMVFKQGQTVDQMVGAIPKDQIMAKVNPQLS